MGRFSRAYRQYRKEGGAKPQFTGSKPSMLLYLGVGMIAVLKDLLDLVLIGSLPGIGTVITFCFTFLIWMLLTLFDHSGGKQNLQIIRGLVITFFGLVEMVAIGFNFLPIQTFTVVVLYTLARRAWRKQMKAEERAMKQGARTSKREKASMRRRAAEEEQAQRVQQLLEYQSPAANDPRYQQNEQKNRKVV